MSETFVKDYIVTFDYGDYQSIYLFPQMTRRQIIKYIVVHDLLGEACRSVSTEETAEKSKEGVMFLAALRTTGEQP